MHTTAPRIFPAQIRHGDLCSITVPQHKRKGKAAESRDFISLSGNLVERFFRDLIQNRLRRGVFRDVEELIMAIGDYIDRHNENPEPFIWTARASDILEKVKRAHHALDKGQSD